MLRKEMRLHYSSSSTARITTLETLKVRRQTPVASCVTSRTCGNFRVLLENGTDANARDDNASPFYLAYGLLSGRECADIVRLLLKLKPEYRSNINAQDNKGQTPFMIATENGEHDVGVRRKGP